MSTMSVLKTVGARSPHHPGRTPEGPEMWQTRRVARWQWCRSYQSLSLCTSRHITFLSRCLVSYFQVVSFALSDGEQARIPQQLHPHMERYRSQHRPTYTYVCLCGRDNALINTTTSEKTGDQGGPARRFRSLKRSLLDLLKLGPSYRGYKENGSDRKLDISLVGIRFLV
jgi:hypothetical protein